MCHKLIFLLILFCGLCKARVGTIITQVKFECDLRTLNSGDCLEAMLNFNATLLVRIPLTFNCCKEFKHEGKITVEPLQTVGLEDFSVIVVEGENVSGMLS